MGRTEFRNYGNSQQAEVATSAAEKCKHREWTSVHDNYYRQQIVGQGTYGVVFSGHNRHTGQKVAMKRSQLDVYAEEGIPATAFREVALLNDLKNVPNVVQLQEISCTSSRLYLICEFLDRDLKKHLKENNRRLDYSKVKYISHEILKGVAWCHGIRVIHRDLKPHNILLDKEARVIKIADFGLARPNHAPGKTLTHEVITLWYRPPELLLGGSNYTDAVDIWSAGCIIAELLSGYPLFQGDSEIDTLFHIFKLLGTPTSQTWPGVTALPEGQLSHHWPQFKGHSDPFGQLNQSIDAAGKDLLQRMLAYDPDSRITAKEALEHPWFAELRQTDSVKNSVLHHYNAGGKPLTDSSSNSARHLLSNGGSRTGNEIDRLRPQKRVNHGGTHTTVSQRSSNRLVHP